MEKDLALKEACWLELEAELQGTVSSLEKELELEREQHDEEVQEPPGPPRAGASPPHQNHRTLRQIFTNTAVRHPETGACRERLASLIIGLYVLQQHRTYIKVNIKEHL